MSSRPAEDARASIRPTGSKARASRRGRGTIRLAVTTRRKLARRPRVVVRYRSATASVRAVVPTGRIAKLAAGGR